jgi:hypothetical protein
MDAKKSELMLSEFRLCKCRINGKIMVRFEKESHEHEIHNGKPVEWKRMR